MTNSDQKRISVHLLGISVEYEVASMLWLQEKKEENIPHNKSSFFSKEWHADIDYLMTMGGKVDNHTLFALLEEIPGYIPFFGALASDTRGKGTANVGEDVAASQIGIRYQNRHRTVQCRTLTMIPVGTPSLPKKFE
ncbi:hypothetical protein SS1G_03200 [Sclerotinia sclerotiorum 1980 UF-70]|uniref:Uncharacterized protein n=1 Tax=Sclerotinia sclerotiorum (strain ATCC 18683 / 1980 / Ss-1) TaxID=665079 RepID=A7ED11_SCLS1|nr:hypothetical protein SS1G_03200 [Sclerotinia sclerotiorum 1980 UF-70]EDO00727.1 hypothetical protein SS1G_03200 [Sclerotinia sclerotiorum 1980 UF-70]